MHLKEMNLTRLNNINSTRLCDGLAVLRTADGNIPANQNAGKSQHAGAVFLSGPRRNMHWPVIRNAW